MLEKNTLPKPEVLSLDKVRPELVSLEILKFTDEVKDLTELEIRKKYRKAKEHFIKIDDLSQTYVIRLVVDNKENIKSLEPDFLPEGDVFEVSESIQGILKDFGINVYGSDFSEDGIKMSSQIKKDKLSDAIKVEMVKGLKKLQKIEGGLVEVVGEEEIEEEIEKVSDESNQK